MADRYWVGGTGAWSSTNTANWSTSSGGTGGASVPTSADDVYIDSPQAAVTVTVTTSASCRTLNFTGFIGTFAGSSTIDVYGSITLNADMNYTHTGNITIRQTGTILTFGKLLPRVFINTTGTVTLGDAFTSRTGSDFYVTQGQFNTANYNFTTAKLYSSGYNTRTINLGSSTVTLTSIGQAFNTEDNTGLTFNAGTSTIIMSGQGLEIVTALPGQTGITFYNVSITNTAVSTNAIIGTATYNNLSIAGPASIGVKTFTFNSQQTINGTLTLSPGTNATMRTFVRSNTIGTTRTLTCAAVSATDVDFQDITIAGSAAPVSGTRLGDCKGNSGITFDAPKTVYWIATSGANWGASTSSWSLTDGGTPTHDAFPLAQDTAVFPTTLPSATSTATINVSYNIGTIDMSARTSNTMTLATGTNAPTIYGNWINGTGTTISGTGTLTFAGRGSQTITSVGKTFTQSINIDSPGGSVTLLDALTTNSSAFGALTVRQGTFDANGYNVTLSGTSGSFASNVSRTRTVAIGSGTWTIAGSGTAWNISSITGLTVTGTGTINLSATASRTFAGGGVQTYPTITQSNASTLTITGSNKFADITNTALGAVRFTGGTTTEFGAFNLNGTSTAARLTVGSTNTTQAILKKSTAWNVGTGSLDGGNNTGLSFTAGTNDFLSISGINGVVSGGGIITVYISENALVNSSESSVGSYKSDINESLLTNDLNSTKLTFFGATAEAIYVSDAFGASKEFLLSVTESITSTDLIRASSAFASLISELTNSSDNIFARPILGAFVSETITASEAQASGLICLGTLSESATAADVAAAFRAYLSAVAESTTANDLIAASLTLNAAISELTIGSEQVANTLSLNALISELTTGSEQVANTLSLNALISELASAIDSLSGGLLFISSVSESTTAQELVAASLIFNLAISEAATATELIAASLTLNAAISELTSSSESLAVQSILSAPVSEVISAAELLSGGLFFASNISETASVTDAAVALLVFNLSISEATTASEVLAAVATLYAVLPENVSGSDIARALISVNSSVNESLSALEEVVAAMTTRPAISESTSVSESLANTYFASSSIRESIQVVDLVQVVASTFAASSNELSSASDLSQGANTGSSSLSEGVLASDDFAVAFIPQAMVLESAQTTESELSVASFVGSTIEIAASSDISSVLPSVFNAVAAAAAQASDAFNPAGSVYNATLPIESAVALDSIIGAFLWNDIDDTQLANWQNVSSGQTPAWTSVVDAQTPGWQGISSTQSPTWTQVDDEQVPVWVVIPTSKD